MGLQIITQNLHRKGDRSEMPWPTRSIDLSQVDFLRENLYLNMPFNDGDHLEQNASETVQNININREFD